MKYFSMFSGIGGFELGIQRATDNTCKEGQVPIKQNICTGRDSTNDSKQREKDRSELSNNSAWECIGFSEIDKYAIATYQSHFPEHKNYGDATKINPSELPDFDLLCGGFPCQAFSIAGKRMGFEDTRGTLFFDIARIVKVKRPRFLFLENVKGLLSHDNGRTIATILATIDELGYNAEWQVLNSKHFGVPQNRERIFIIGHLRGTSSRQIFPIGTINQRIDERTSETTIVRCFTAGGNSGGLHSSMTLLQMDETKGNSQGDRVYSIDGISQTLAGQAGGKGAKKGGTGLLESSEHCSTIDSTPHIVNRIRRLTPTECERLQGFPDGWTLGSDTQRYKQCGNAVTVNVIEQIARGIQDVI